MNLIEWVCACACVCVHDRKRNGEGHQKNGPTLVGVLVAYLADTCLINIWVHIWPGAFIVCPGSNIVAQVYVHVW